MQRGGTLRLVFYHHPCQLLGHGFEGKTRTHLFKLYVSLGGGVNLRVTITGIRLLISFVTSDHVECGPKAKGWGVLVSHTRDYAIAHVVLSSAAAAGPAPSGGSGTALRPEPLGRPGSVRAGRDHHQLTHHRQEH